MHRLLALENQRKFQALSHNQLHRKKYFTAQQLTEKLLWKLFTFEFCIAKYSHPSKKSVVKCRTRAFARRWNAFQSRTAEAWASLEMSTLIIKRLRNFSGWENGECKPRTRSNLNNKFAQSCCEFKANSNSNELDYQLRKPSESFEAWDKINFPGLSLITSDLQCSFMISKASGGDSGREISSSVRQAIKTGIFKRVKHQ